MMGGGDAGWALVSLLIFLAVALTVAWALTGSAGAPHTAGQILNERLARGDITPEQYRALRATLVRTRQAPSRTPRRAVAVAAAVAVAGVVLVGASAGTSGERWPGWMRTMHEQMWGTRRGVGGQAPPPVAGAREVRVVAAEFLFEPTDLRVRTGETINIVLDNRGSVFHDFHIQDLDFELEANGGDQDTGAFAAPDKPGRYPIVCDVPGHAAAGMRATLTVETAVR